MKYEVGLKTENNIEIVGRSFRHSKAGKKINQFDLTCFCGKNFKRDVGDVNRQRVVSCGCVGLNKIRQLGEASKKHGLSGSRQYDIWSNMLYRCNNHKYTHYENYGGRGISVCEEWKSFENFWRDMQEGYFDNLEIDRIDVNGNYCKENCRWVDSTIQNLNRRTFSNNTTGYTGVYFSKEQNKYFTVLTFYGKKQFFGYFETIEEAVFIRKTEFELTYEKLKEKT